jgi:sulfhydrogenase subunit alpha
MKVDLSVDVHHLPRVEGHGNIVVRVKDGRLEQARWDVVETPRFFEVMLKGMHYTGAALLTSRICGICSISHALASLEATEAAFGVEVPALARKLRLLAKHGETLQSHLLHLFFLAAPDFLGLPSVIPLLERRPEVVDLARRLRGLANRICDVVAGRTTHPVSLTVGGVTMAPTRERLLALRDELERSREDLAAAAALFGSFDLPDFVRETEFVSLRGGDAYPFIGREVVSTDGVQRPREDYLTLTNEFVDGNNTSKWARLSRDAFAVGPLARFNNNHGLLHPEAARVAGLLGLEPVCHNPFFAHAARLVECVQVTHEAMGLIDEIAAVAAPDPQQLAAAVEVRAGRGVGAVEAPRGILYHCYEYDAEGRIVRADCVIPTTQNNLNIHLDLSGLVERFTSEEMTDAGLELLCAMLVRAYDPCISCSVH